MNTANAKKKKKEEAQERSYIEVREMEVKNVRVIAGKNGDIVFFTLVLNGVAIYNCKVGTGKNGDFVSFPQYKGSDGKYYNNAYAFLSEEDQNTILEAIQNEIDA